MTNGVCFAIFGMRAFSKDLPRIVYTLTMTNSWTFFNHGWEALFPFDEQAWTVTTLTSFYVIFPILLPQLQTLSTPRLSSLIIILFYLQCLPLYTVNVLDWFWPTTAHPLSRLPVFVMGMAAGLVRIRGKCWRWRVDFHFLVFLAFIVFKRSYPSWFIFNWNFIGNVSINIHLLLIIIFLLTCIFAFPTFLNLLHDLLPVPWDFWGSNIVDDLR